MLSLSIRGNLLTFLSFDLCLLKFLWYYIVNDNSGHRVFLFRNWSLVWRTKINIYGRYAGLPMESKTFWSVNFQGVHMAHISKALRYPIPYLV